MTGDHQVVAGELMVDGRARGFALRLTRGTGSRMDRVRGRPLLAWCHAGSGDGHSRVRRRRGNLPIRRALAHVPRYPAAV